MKVKLLSCLAFSSAMLFSVGVFAKQSDASNLIGKQNIIKYDPSVTCAKESSSLKKDTFDIVWTPVPAYTNKKYQNTIAITSPKKANEVTAFNKRAPSGLQVSCFPFVPGAKIRHLELIDIEGIPQELVRTGNNSGIRVLTNAKNLQAGPGENICMMIEGTPGANVPKGRYKFNFVVKAKAELLKISKNAKCTVKGGYLELK